MVDEFKPTVVVDGPREANANVVVLKTSTDERRKECVDKLRELLDAAERGQVLDVMIVAYRTNAVYTLHWTTIGDDDLPRQIGALQILSQVLVSKVRFVSGPPK